MTQLINGIPSLVSNIKIQFGSKANSTQHAHRIFTIAFVGVANHANRSALNISRAISKIMYRKAINIVIHSIDGEVTALGVLINSAIDIVTCEHATG